MSDLEDVLLELRYAGLGQLPDAGDAGDGRVRQALEDEIARPHRRFWMTRRRIAIGGFGVTPAVFIAAVATAAAATGGAVFAVNATTKSTVKPMIKSTTNPATKSAANTTAEAIILFQKDPGNPFAHSHHIPKNVFVRKETVIPASVHQRAIATVPNYGKVQFWAATTKQGGFCSAIRLPNGSWAGYPFSQHPTGGFYGGSVPGCIDTEQQRSIGELGQPSVEAPTTHEGFDDEVKTRTGQIWELFFGYVTTQGHAAILKDPATGHTAPVTSDGYFVLAEPLPDGNEDTTFDVLNAAGQPLQPDFTRSGLLPGYKMGPTSGPR